jgi:cytochrome c oxidase assembly protein subunit 15
MTWLHRYAVLVAACTLLLILAGGMVTSTGSGLSVPDWPTTYGYNMFTFPIRSWVGGILYEHGHRLIASTVGMLTIGLALWLWLRDPRGWVRRLGAIGLAAVTLQGVLGGLTVLYFLPAPVSIGHAGLAQLFFCVSVSLALFTSRAWLTPPSAPIDDPMLRRLSLATVAILYAQILLGATMRHTGAGLAIPDFPWAFGHLVPPAWSAPIAIHFAHRVTALVALLAILATSSHVWRHHGGRGELARPAVLLTVLALGQIALGAFVVLTKKGVGVNTAHVAVGSLVLATSLVLALRAHRLRFRDVAVDRRPRIAPARAPSLGTQAS